MTDAFAYTEHASVRVYSTFRDPAFTRRPQGTTI
jgi:hypothetical protein